jgi:hypothetical protein
MAKAGCHRLSRLERIERRDDDDIDQWRPRDAMVMMAVSLVLAHYLPLSPRGTHLKGCGGSKYALREVLKHLRRTALCDELMLSRTAPASVTSRRWICWRSTSLT